MGKVVARNVVAEGISIIEDTISGNEVNFVDSMIDVGFGTALDVGFGKTLDMTVGFANSKMPQNYSSYARRKKAIPGIFRSAIPSFFDNFARYLGFD